MSLGRRRSLPRPIRGVLWVVALGGLVILSAAAIAAAFRLVMA